MSLEELVVGPHMPPALRAPGRVLLVVPCDVMEVRQDNHGSSPKSQLTECFFTCFYLSHCSVVSLSWVEG